MKEETRNTEGLAAIISNGSLLFTDDYTEIAGDVNSTKELTFEGDVKIIGNVIADTIIVEGSAEITGTVEANVMEAGGEITIGGTAIVGDICAENIYVGGNLESSVEVETGLLIVGENLKAFVVSLGKDEEDDSEDKLLFVEGVPEINEALYINGEEVKNL